MQTKWIVVALGLAASALALVAAPPEVPREVKAKPGQVVFVTVKSKEKVGYHVPFTQEVATFKEVVSATEGEREFLFQAPADSEDGLYPVTFWTVGDDRGVSVTIVVAGGAKPPPVGPKDDPRPPSPPSPKADQEKAWTPAALVLVVVEETADAAASRGAIFRDRDLAARMTAKGHKWAAFDKDVIDNTTGKPPPDKEAFIRLAAGKGFPQLFLVDVKTGEVRFQGAMPATAAAVLATLQKVGG